MTYRVYNKWVGSVKEPKHSSKLQTITVTEILIVRSLNWRYFFKARIIISTHFSLAGADDKNFFIVAEVSNCWKALSR